MKIAIDNIPEEGMTINADTRSDSWFSNLMKEAIGNHFVDNDRAALSLNLTKCEENIDISGKVTVLFHPACDRCLKNYSAEDNIPFRIIMAPLCESKKRKNTAQDKELVKEDLGFSFYDGDTIDLDNIVREQILLEEPIKRICNDACKGLCSHCGKDLNDGPCSCRDERRDPRWDVLKKIKMQK